jgi:hypothetical protein
MMKKVLFIIVFLMTALVVDAQPKVVNITHQQPLKKGDRVALMRAVTRIWHRILPVERTGDQKAGMTKGTLPPPGVRMAGAKMPTWNNTHRTTISAADLPKSITDNIAKDCVGCAIKDQTMVVKDKVVTAFEVVVTKGVNSETLTYEEQPAPK